MARIIAITNQKGGVGKTTTCINLAASLAATKRNVLLIDMDPQGNATMGSGVNKNEVQATTGDMLTGDIKPEDLIIDMREDAGYDIMPSNGDLTVAEVTLKGKPNAEISLRLALSSLKERYDYILIDCPPSLNMLTLNALVAADSVMIPMQCEYYALEGLSALLETVEGIRETVNTNVNCAEI